MRTRTTSSHQRARVVDLVLLVLAATALVAIGLAIIRGDGTAGHFPALVGPSLVLVGVVLAGRVTRPVAGFHTAREALERAERRHRVLAESTADATILVDRAGVVVEASPGYGEVIGDPNADPVGRHLLRRVHPDVRDSAMRRLDDVLSRPGARFRAEVPIVNDDGEERWLEVRATNLLEDPDVGVLIVNLHDVTDRRVAEEQLRHQAFHDPVTGAANRALLTDQVLAANRRRSRAGGTSALVLLDLDDFSGVNERLGHDGGDLLLRQVHQRLLAVVRAGDTVARLGGDQFAVLIAQAHEGPDEALAMARRITARLDEPYRISGTSVIIGTSIGVAVASDPAADADELLRDAAVALSHAKAAGRGHVTLFEPAMRDAALDRLRIEADLLVALERDELVLHYQPLVELRTGKVAGVEALIRWIHPVVGLVPPDRFIGLAEQNGMIVPIGEWVIRRACTAAAGWRATLGHDLEVSVNVSARQLVSNTLVPTIGLAVAESGMAPGDLTVEITESAVVTDPELAARRLGEIRELGVQVAIDDFGTGYSSLSYLQHLPVDVLKIDRSFINGITAEAPPPPIVQGLVDLAATLGLATVAEGVEHGHQVDYLRSLGCTYGQGFHFARPLPESDVLERVGQGPLGAGRSAVVENESSDPRGSLM